MFRPPIDRTMKALDRTFFHKTVNLAAARTVDNRKLSELRKTLANEILRVDRLQSIRPSPIAADKDLDRKAILLQPEIRHDQPNTWTSTLNQLKDQNLISIIPYDLELDYSYWSYDEIMQAILPDGAQEEIPSGFAIVGHIAHLNLRERFLPYKHLIAEVLMDKAPVIKTVINKIEDVGSENEFRTFRFEVLKGEPNFDVEVSEQGCIFRFDYSKVYWNTRLNTEHERLTHMFQPGEAVCDVMAGIGPFAVPAAKKKVFVWANDLNPVSYESMMDARQRNKVTPFLKCFNMDGRAFIRQSAQDLMQHDHTVEIKPQVKERRSRSSQQKPAPAAPSTFMEQPKTFQHYVMNLPATATEFLDAFIGLYSGHEFSFEPHTDRKLPMIHVHCFSTKSEDNKREGVAIRKELSHRLGYEMEEGENELTIFDVRDVAPNKRMFCASFRLPPAVAFRS